ncbi:MAG TPA: SDR family oxidoreductase [Mycobacteriales bacterium]|jgi:NAD(P)-dependent dehydrogenase (short-subunit alcohol dehydrogenase family)|nr:SDR family oxidoreductase [Mycobacteriales bacterium]
MDDFKGRTALVTGATRGIGFGIAEELVARGANVCITARKPDELAEAVKSLDPDGSGRAIAARGSADDPDHQRAAVEETVSTFGRLDILVNNAAVNPQYGPLMDADIGAVRKVFEVNVIAVLAWSQRAWEASMREHGGSILNVASVGGLRAGSPIGAYNASKAALIHLTRQLAVEMSPGVRVNGIAPAVVKTKFARALYEGREEEVASHYPLKRLGRPEDTAKLAAFLLSDDASWITGETVTIDGGITVGGGV